MSHLKGRWKLIRSNIGWEYYLGFTILLIGIFGFFVLPLPFWQGLSNAYEEIRAELIGIGIAVLIIDNTNEAIKRREEKKRLILQLGSPDHAFAIEAARQLREREWLFDGPIRGAYLGGANLWGANLREANLEGTDLSGVNMEGAEVTSEQLDQSKSLEGASFPDGRKKPEGVEEDQE